MVSLMLYYWDERNKDMKKSKMEQFTLNSKICILPPNLTHIQNLERTKEGADWRAPVDNGVTSRKVCYNKV